MDNQWAVEIAEKIKKKERAVPETSSMIASAGN